MRAITPRGDAKKAKSIIEVMGIAHAAAYARAIVNEGNASPLGRLSTDTVSEGRRKIARAARLLGLCLP